MSNYLLSEKYTMLALAKGYIAKPQMKAWAWTLYGDGVLVVETLESSTKITPNVYIVMDIIEEDHIIIGRIADKYYIIPLWVGDDACLELFENMIQCKELSKWSSYNDT